MKTILSIDDEEGLRFIFSTSLRERGYQIIEAAGSQSGLGLFLVQKLIAENRASLSIESLPSEGMQVKVAFQINNADSTSQRIKG